MKCIPNPLTIFFGQIGTDGLIIQNGTRQVFTVGSFFAKTDLVHSSARTSRIERSILSDDTIGQYCTQYSVSQKNPPKCIYL